MKEGRGREGGREGERSRPVTSELLNSEYFSGG